MSRSKGKRSTKFENAFRSKSKFLYSNIVGTKRVSVEVLNMMHLVPLFMRWSRNERNEDNIACSEDLLDGKCQEQNAADILKFWKNVHKSVKQLSVSLRSYNN